MLKEKMTTEQFVSDTIEVSKYLCERFQFRIKYILWHTHGVHIWVYKQLQKAPELFHAYIGIGQIVNTLESEKIAYDYMVKYYETAGEEKTVKKLRIIF